jgi:hypothetical protein
MVWLLEVNGDKEYRFDDHEDAEQFIRMQGGQYTYFDHYPTDE